MGEPVKGKGGERVEAHDTVRRCFYFTGNLTLGLASRGRNCDGQGEFGIGLRQNDCALN